MKTLLVLSIVALSTVWAIPHKPSIEVPGVGEVFGPLSDGSEGVLRKEGDKNSWVFTWIFIADDTMLEPISTDEVFDNKEKLYQHTLNHVDADSVAVQVDPNELKGKYVEILSKKLLSGNNIQKFCHDSPGAIFCHVPANAVHETKYVLAMVKRMDTNTILPVVFFSHKVCNFGPPCFWVTHFNAITVINKSAIN